MEVWLRAAMLFMALASLVLGATFLYVWRLLDRRHVLFWGIAWLLAIPHIALCWYALEAPSYLARVVSELLVVANALFMVAGCYEFIYRKAPARRLVLLVTPVLVWVLVAPTLSPNLPYLSAPSSVLLGASFLWVGSRFLLQPHSERPTGSRMVALLFFVAGLHEFDYPFLVGIEGANVAGYYIAAVLALSIAVSLLIMVLETARAGLAREQARLRGVLNQLPVGVLEATPEGRISLSNQAAEDLFVDRPMGPPTTIADLQSSLIRDGDLAAGRSCRPLSDMLRADRATTVQRVGILDRDGNRRSVLLQVGPVLGEDGSQLSSVAVLQDVTALERMQAEVLRTERLRGLGTLAVGVAHDFNNALTLILGHAELAAMKTSKEDAKQELKIIARVAKDSAGLTRKLQGLAGTRERCDSEIIDLAEVAQEVVEVSRPRWRDQAHAQGVSYDVRTRLPDRLPVRGEAGELREALLNLVFNALEAMPGGGELEITGAREEHHIRLEVRDSGVGIAGDIRERIFDPFFTTKGQGGTGLGLAIVYGIVTGHDGDITVSSRIGEGSSFTVRLPIALDGEGAEVARRESNAALPRTLRVLAVDDEAPVLEVAGALLASLGHHVMTAQSGPRALQLVQSLELDMVLTDLGMPGMNGWQLAEEVRRIRPELPIVLMTGWGDAISAVRARELGIARVIAKPFRQHELEACIGDAVKDTQPSGGSSRSLAAR